MGKEAEMPGQTSVAPRDAVLDHQVADPRVVAVPPPPPPAARVVPLPVSEPAPQPAAAQRARRLDAETKERLGEAAFLAIWTPALALASVIGAAALAVASPVVLAVELRRERRFR
jgi:hypothetical protein